MSEKAKFQKKAPRQAQKTDTKIVVQEQSVVETNEPVVETVIPWAPDKDWTQDQWQGLLNSLIKEKLVTWKEVTATVLGQMNPSQVGTSLASNKRVQAFHQPRKVWQAVRSWFYEQPGRCINCGTRLELQADHITSREAKGDDRLENFQLLCRRCNVVKRPSHKKGGVTYLTAESALMWILFVYKPTNYNDFKNLCRKYGLTMADIRFQEAWAMARWLHREGLYKVDKESIL
jgi:5-methylcytosine-specific restriction endonuclease McrA